MLTPSGLHRHTTGGRKPEKAKEVRVSYCSNQKYKDDFLSIKANDVQPSHVIFNSRLMTLEVSISYLFFYHAVKEK